MKITALRIMNYKGFQDSGYVELDLSWNVVVGQNNAGKTAFIEAFRLSRNTHNPHKDSDIPLGQPLPPVSRFFARLQLSREWMRDAWLRSRRNFALPTQTTHQGVIARRIDPKTFWDGPDLTPELAFVHDGVSAEWPSHQLFEQAEDRRFHELLLTEDHLPGGIQGPAGGGTDSLPIVVEAETHSKIYVFEAKRFAVGECPHEDTSLLRPDAGNLPAVLINLKGNPDLFREYIENVSSIFPTIRDVTVTAKDAAFEIKLWSVPPESRRHDLAVPLNESGTGVGQVLAILYVAMTNAPGIIVIDEPNSFLHPGAAKKLIQVLKRYPQHQYIISTHSPEVITAAQPAKLHMVRAEDGKSHIETLGESEIETMRMMLEEVGASMSDLFAAERVIWVEGPTERECFDLIVRLALKRSLIGLAFVALRNTGDFEGKNADTAAVIEIYTSLSRGGSILPQTVAFSFDRELKTPQKIADLERAVQGRAHVLPRRMTENYLLHPEAIAHVINDLDEGTVVTSEQIGALIQERAQAWMPRGDVVWGDPGAIEVVDGANLLDDIFTTVSEQRVTYRKVRDAVELLRWVLSNETATVQGLIDYVERLLAADRVPVET